MTEGAPALLRRWGGNGPIGWRANMSPWFRSPLFGSSFSIDDVFGTMDFFKNPFIFLHRLSLHAFDLLGLNQEKGVGREREKGVESVVLLISYSMMIKSCRYFFCP